MSNELLMVFDGTSNDISLATLSPEVLAVMDAAMHPDCPTDEAA